MKRLEMIPLYERVIDAIIDITQFVGDKDALEKELKSTFPDMTDFYYARGNKLKYNYPNIREFDNLNPAIKYAIVFNVKIVKYSYIDDVE